MIAVAATYLINTAVYYEQVYTDGRVYVYIVQVPKYKCCLLETSVNAS